MRPKPGTDIISKRWSDPSGITAQIQGPGGGYNAAQAIQRIGAMNSLGGQDTRLVHVNPNEEAWLKARGGSGRIDPVTGLAHYEENDETVGYDDNGRALNRQGQEVGRTSGGWDTTSHRYVAPNKLKQTVGKLAGGWLGGTLGGPLGAKAGAFVGGNWGRGGMVSNNNYGGTGNTSTRGGVGPGGRAAGDTTYDPYSTTLGGIYGGTGTLGGGGAITGTSIGGGGTGSGMFPSVYTDPVTGRLLYQSQSVGGTSNLSYADQQMLDQLQGTNVASQNITQQIGNLNRTIEDMKKAGGDTRYYEAELARLQGLQSQSAGASNPLLDYVNSGLQERVANEQLDNTVANQLRSMEQTQARRGLGVLGSPMTDQLRASLGLSTAQARTQNKLNAQDQAFKNRMNLMSYLKQSQNQDYTQDMGRTGIGMTLGDWENQRKIAETTMRNQNKQYQDMLDAQGDANMWGAIGDIAGSIDWGSIF